MNVMKAHVSLNVSDVNASVAFYEKAFGVKAMKQRPGYAKFDLAGSARLFRWTTLIGRIDNLLDKHYQEILGYPALGRAFYLGMRFRIGGE